MKTPEDEAFDELATRQGHWGGGFKAKQAMAADKLQEPVREALKLALEALEEHHYGVAQIIIREALAQPAQEPVSFPCCGYTDANAIRWNQFNGVVQCHMCGQVYTVAQPAQEQRPWAGLTEEDLHVVMEEESCSYIAGAKWAEEILRGKNG